MRSRTILASVILLLACGLMMPAWASAEVVGHITQVEGRVEEFLVNEGDRVAMGQPLARLRSTTLDLQMKAAQAELSLRQAELSELTKSAPKEIEQAKARMDSAEAQMIFNDKRMKRFQELFDKRALSDDELEEQVYAAEASQKNFAEAKSAWELATSGIWDAKIAQGQARVDVQRETINQLADEIQKHTIMAPFAGYVTREDVEVGQDAVAERQGANRLEGVAAEDEAAEARIVEAFEEVEKDLGLLEGLAARDGEACNGWS